jgi:hypothetical protein
LSQVATGTCMTGAGHRHELRTINDGQIFSHDLCGALARRAARKRWQ